MTGAHYLTVSVEQEVWNSWAGCFWLEVFREVALEMLDRAVVS